MISSGKALGLLEERVRPAHDPVARRLPLDALPGPFGPLLEVIGRAQPPQRRERQNRRRQRELDFASPPFLDGFRDGDGTLSLGYPDAFLHARHVGRDPLGHGLGIVRPVFELDRQAVLRQANQLGLGSAAVEPSQGIGRVAVGCLAEDLGGIMSREGRRTCEDLAEDRAQGEDVGPRVDPDESRPRLLGGHVARRAHDRAAAGRVSRPEPLPAVVIRGSPRAALWPALASSAAPPLGRTLARPQSMTWTSPKLPTITLEGFRSRWITSREWA